MIQGGEGDTNASSYDRLSVLSVTPYVKHFGIRRRTRFWAGSTYPSDTRSVNGEGVTTLKFSRDFISSLICTDTQ